MDSTAFSQFFRPYSQNVDNAAKLHFWRFSDRLVIEIMKQHLLHLGPSSVLLDAGGGTGRWIQILANLLPCKFILYDLSEDMLKKAESNLAEPSLRARSTIVHGNLEEMGKLEDESVDGIISLYAPIGFVVNPPRAVKELFRVLRPGGKILMMGHSYHNSLYSKINNYLAPGGEILKMKENYTVKWAEFVPELHTFSAESMRALLEQGGFSVHKVYGLPIYLQPGPEDFDQENKLQSRISKYLSDPEVFESMVTLEMSVNSDPALVNRGVNILGVGTKL